MQRLSSLSILRYAERNFLMGRYYLPIDGALDNKDEVYKILDAARSFVETQETSNKIKQI